MRVRLAPLLIALLVVVALVLAGCGRSPSATNANDDDDSGGSMPKLNFAPRPAANQANANANRNANTAGNNNTARNTPANTGNTTPANAGNTNSNAGTASHEFTLPIEFRALPAPPDEPLADWLEGNMASFDFATAMLLLAREMNPRLDLAAETARINALAQGLATALGKAATPRQLKEAISQRIFRELRLRFHSSDDDNSRTDAALLSVPTVLDTCEGNCVSLSALVLMVCDRLGLQDAIHAATLPRHMYLRVDARTTSLEIIETSQPDVPTSDERLARELKLDWPLPASSPFARSLDRRETFGAALNNYGLVLDAQPDKGLIAIRWFETAMRLWPRNVHAHENAGGIALREASKLDNDDAARVELLKKAVVWLGAAVRMWPGSADSWLFLSHTQRLLGRADDAIKTLDEAAPYLDATAWEPQHLRFLALLRADKGPEALKVIEAAKSVLPSDADTQAEYSHAHAVALILCDRTKDAAPDIQRTLITGNVRRQRMLMRDVMTHCDSGSRIPAGLDFYRSFAKHVERADDAEKRYVADLGSAFASHIVQPVKDGDAPTPASVKVAIDVLTLSIGLHDEFNARHDLFVLLWTSDRHDEAAAHGFPAIEFATDPKDKVTLLLTMANYYANQHENGIDGLGKVVAGLKALPAPFNVEALMFEGVLTMNKPPQSRVSLGKALALFERYIAEGGTNPNATMLRDEIKKALAR
ncbi:MAG: transglutaminase family protein [Planctomycetota bacterium]